MEDLKGYQKKYLRGLAHGFKPVVFVGQKGFTDALVREVAGALKTHELIKVKFIDFKEKGQKETIAASIVAATGAAMAGMIGHMAIFYLCHPDPDKRKIKLPTQSG